MDIRNEDLIKFMEQNPKLIGKHTEIAILFGVTPERIRSIARKYFSYTKEVRQQVMDAATKRHIEAKPICTFDPNPFNWKDGYSPEEQAILQKGAELRAARGKNPSDVTPQFVVEKDQTKEWIDRVEASYSKEPLPYKGNPDNVLVIGDLHAPFILDGYLEFCREQQERYDCGTVVQIGDLTDGHSYSYHDPDPDGLSPGDEIDEAKRQLEKVFRMFPEAYCTLGNHDMLPYRKALSQGLSKKFIKSMNDIWGAPIGWKFDMEFNINGVLYVHGTGSSGANGAFNRARDSRINVVMGHLHSYTSVQYSASHRDLLWAMQVGCGLDNSKYAFAYGQTFAKKPIISCGVVLNKGTTPIVLSMPLGTNYPKTNNPRV